VLNRHNPQSRLLASSFIGTNRDLGESLAAPVRHPDRGHRNCLIACELPADKLIEPLLRFVAAERTAAA
jgi:hypothetical protein